MLRNTTEEERNLPKYRTSTPELDKLNLVKVTIAVDPIEPGFGERQIIGYECCICGNISNIATYCLKH